MKTKDKLLYIWISFLIKWNVNGIANLLYWPFNAKSTISGKQKSRIDAEMVDNKNNKKINWWNSVRVIDRKTLNISEIIFHGKNF
jgi:hypothetical protein